MANEHTPFEALELAVDTVGGQSALARLCDVAQPSVWKWLQSSKRLPAEHVLTVEAATGISRHDLRPDIYPRDYPPAPEFMGVDSGRLHVSFNRHGTLQAGRPA